MARAAAAKARHTGHTRLPHRGRGHRRARRDGGASAHARAVHTRYRTQPCLHWLPGLAKPLASVSSVFTVEGWAADDDGVVEVRIYVDRDRAVVVRPSIARPDVDALFPHVARERHGFGAELNVGSKIGPCVIRADVLDKRGAVTTVARARIAIDP